MSNKVNDPDAVPRMLSVLIPMSDSGRFDDIDSPLELVSAFESALRERGVIASDESLSLAAVARLMDAISSNERQHLDALEDRLKDQTAQLDPS
ncbi:hypothetical protein [Thiocapsa sp. UBA6158]|jgi:hypothetical protein|uniref:hypothetical protein n=1 Tax=Thiocapsa sp. UBA6158 TaxID=1947692 RepID=UPI0025DE8788|nr:hypothetical protein [Thiocapsa sp. UBA6158]